MGIPSLILFLFATQNIFALPIIDNPVLSRMEESGGVEVLIEFNATSTSDVISAATSGRKFGSRTDRIHEIVEALTAHATRTQERTLKALRENRDNPEDIVDLWMTNQIYVRGFNSKLMKALEDTDAAFVKLHSHIELPRLHPSVGVGRASKPPDIIPIWGVSAMKVPVAWGKGFNGQGAIVAFVDTGARGSHEALRDNIMRPHGWLDAVHGKPEPYDDHPYSYGTFGLGSAVGRKNVGVAPGAKWMACKACDKNGLCPMVSLIRCGQFVLCPDNLTGNKRCQGAAHVVSNSYGGGRPLPEMKAILSTWYAGGITTVFSVGADGPKCRTAIWQAQMETVLAVSAVDENFKLLANASRGPSFGTVPYLPTVVVPGYKVLSASNAGDDVYVEMSMIHLAGSHAAGVTALLISADKSLSPDQVREALTKGAEPTIPTNQVCGGMSDTLYPNNHVGAGFLNAAKSLAIVLKK